MKIKRSFELRRLVLFFAFTIGLIAATLSSGSAQDDEITKEDAIAFIQKFYSEYTDDIAGTRVYETGNSSFRHITFHVEGCNAYIVYITEFYFTKSIFTKHTITIPLDKVYIGSSFLSSYLMAHDKVVTENLSKSKKIDGRYKDDPSMTSKKELIDVLFGLSKESFIFSENQKDKRVMNAYSFLIKSCGGGKKTNPDDKF